MWAESDLDLPQQKKPHFLSPRKMRRTSRQFTSVATTGCAPMGKIPDTAAARKALKVAEIKALLEEAGLATDGTKPTLLERLEEVRSTPERIPNPVPI